MQSGSARTGFYRSAVRLPSSRTSANRIITLPVGDSDSGRPPPRVLVCDDNASVTQLLESLFDLEGWAVDVVSNGWDFLVRLADNWPDAVVLDQWLVDLNGLTGLEAAAIARDDGFDRPIVLFSAHLDLATRVRAHELGLLEVSKVDFPAVVRHVTAAHEDYIAAGARSAIPGPSGN